MARLADNKGLSLSATPDECDVTWQCRPLPRQDIRVLDGQVRRRKQPGQQTQRAFTRKSTTAATAATTATLVHRISTTEL